MSYDLFKKVLTPKGKRWLKRFKLSDRELCCVFSATDCAYSEAWLQHNCGAVEIHAARISLPQLLGTMIGYASGACGEYATLFIATFNHIQEREMEVFRKAGFKGPKKGVTNPNSGSTIYGMVGMLNPEYVNDWQDEEDDDGDIW